MDNSQMMAALLALPDPDLITPSTLDSPLDGGRYYSARTVLKLLKRTVLTAWQPIATAPRDTVILLGYAPHPRLAEDRRVYEGRWHDEQQTWTSVNGFLLHTGATHWQPLPVPPKSA